MRWLLLLLPVLVGADYVAKDFSHLLGMEGFTDKALNMHFKLYQGYVKNTNLNLQLMKQLAAKGKLGSPEWGGLKLRFGWEWDGMRLHELYFENLGGRGRIDRSSDLYRAIVDQWGSYGEWAKEYMTTGIIRGIGWVILYQDPETGLLFNEWINEHDRGHWAGGNPLVVMDVWEHAYLLDYGLDRKAYISAFMQNLDWKVIEKRFQSVVKNRSSPRSASPLPSL